MNKKIILILFIFSVAIIGMFLTKTKVVSIESPFLTPKQPAIGDSVLSFKKSLANINIPESILTTLCVFEVNYSGFDSIVHTGQIVAAKELKEEIILLFDSICKLKFPIEKIIPMAHYDWSDSLSMADNNTSCFNYRTVKGSTRLSYHSYGKAIDINPMQNPYIKYNTNVKEPQHATYDYSIQGTIAPSSQIVRLFKDKGWKWGGDWKYTKDYQHFYKNIPTAN